MSNNENNKFDYNMNFDMYNDSDDDDSSTEFVVKNVCKESDQKQCSLKPFKTGEGTSTTKGGNLTLSDTMDTTITSTSEEEEEEEEVKNTTTTAASIVESQGQQKDDHNNSFQHGDRDQVQDEFSSPTKTCLTRIHNDLMYLYKEPMDGIFVVQDDIRTNRCHAIIVGPEDTPYAYGFFYFILDFPNTYPHVPPRVILQTTDCGKVRFNPNLYACGKVCLSILGTWDGPSWSPVHNIGSVLLSIQSLMNSTPYHNEPGFEHINKFGQQPKNYNHIIRHETIRVGVLQMIEWTNYDGVFPEPLQQLIRSTFEETAELCKYVCEEYSFLDERNFLDPYGNNKGTFHFKDLNAKLTTLMQDNNMSQQKKK